MAHSFSVCLKSQIHCLFERVGAELLFVLIRCSRVLKNNLQAFERDIALVVKFLCLVSSFVESSLDIGFGFLLGGVTMNVVPASVAGWATLLISPIKIGA